MAKGLWGCSSGGEAEMTETNPILVARNLSRHFGGLHAVSDVTLEVYAGELLAVIGPNGAGKTTFFNILSRQIDASNGSIEFAGEDITRVPPHRLPAIGISRTFQRTNLFWDLTVRENVRLAAQAHMIGGYPITRRLHSYPAVRERVGAVLHQVGLEEQADLVANKLSHGDQRLAEVAIALAAAPKLVLLDEPLAGMGPTETRRAVQLFKSLKGAHTVLLIEHDVDVVLDIADRIAVLHFGKLIAIGTPAAIKADPLVQSAYLGAELTC
jgi:branched-chain amino acid transport system ATP-binding protein